MTVFRRLRPLLLALALAIVPLGPVQADILAVVIDRDSLPEAAGPAQFRNNPANFANSTINFRNSGANFRNSPVNIENSPGDTRNSPRGTRRIYAEDETLLGYYVFGEGGILNLYSYAARRIAYLPPGGHTRSLFSEEGWCGTLGDINGIPVLGLSEPCFHAFLAPE